MSSDVQMFPRSWKTGKVGEFSKVMELCKITKRFRKVMTFYGAPYKRAHLFVILH